METNKDNPELRAFVAWMLDPEFDVKQPEEGPLVVSSRFLEYRITPAEDVPAGVAERFYAYDRLNAVHKAMADPKLPPFPQLKVTELLEERKIIPSRIDVTIRIGGREVLLSAESEIAALNDEERTRFAALLEEQADERAGDDGE